MKEFIKENLVDVILFTLLFFMLLFVIFSNFRDYKRTESEKVRDFQAIIFETNYDVLSFTTGKSKQPQLCNSVLFKAISGRKSGQYFKLNSCQDGGRFLIDSWVYNHQKNDTVNFEYLSEKRFFEIRER